MKKPSSTQLFLSAPADLNDYSVLSTGATATALGQVMFSGPSWRTKSDNAFSSLHKKSNILSLLLEFSYPFLNTLARLKLLESLLV